MSITLDPRRQQFVDHLVESGAYADGSEIVAEALDILLAQQEWIDAERPSLVAQIEEGFLDAQAGRITPGDRARAQFQAMKLDWFKRQSSE